MEVPWKDHRIEGIVKYFYANGRVRSEIPHKDGKGEGTAGYYDEVGRLWWRILWNNDEPISGSCGDGRTLTNAEITNYVLGVDPSCSPQR